MTGPEHYKLAQDMLDSAQSWWYDEETRPEAEFFTAAAQVHATLALAAATAVLPGQYGEDGFADQHAWYAVAGEPLKGGAS
jgi:hypothetical protein